MPPHLAASAASADADADAVDGRILLSRIRSRTPGLYSMVELLWHDGAVDLPTLRVHQVLYNQVVEDFNQLVKITQPLLGGLPPVATLPTESLPSDAERSSKRRTTESRVLASVHETQKLLDERMGRMQSQLKANLDEKLRLQEELAELRRAHQMLQEQSRRREAELVTAIEREAEHKARAQLHRERLEEELSRARGGEEDADAHLHEVHRALDTALEQIKQLSGRREAAEDELARERHEHAACQRRLSEAEWQLEGAKERAAGKEAQLREAQAALLEAQRQAGREVEARAKVQAEAELLRRQARDAEERAAAHARGAAGEDASAQRTRALEEEAERRGAEVRELEARKARILDAFEASLRDIAARPAPQPAPAPLPAAVAPTPPPPPAPSPPKGAGSPLRAAEAAEVAHLRELREEVEGRGEELRELEARKARLLTALVEASREVAALEARRRAADAAAADEERGEREKLRRVREDLLKLGRDTMAMERRRSDLREEVRALEQRRTELSEDVSRLARSAEDGAVLSGPSSPPADGPHRLAALHARNAALERKCRDQGEELRALTERNFRLVERLQRLGSHSLSPARREPGGEAGEREGPPRGSPLAASLDDADARVATRALRAAGERLRELGEQGRALRRLLEEAARPASAAPSPFSTPGKRDGSESEGEEAAGTLLQKLSALETRIDGVAEAAGEIARRADRLSSAKEEAGQLAGRLAALEAHAAALTEAVEEAVRVREAFAAWRVRMAKVEELAAVRGEELHEKRLQAQRAAAQMTALGESLRSAEREGQLLREKARLLAVALADAGLPAPPLAVQLDAEIDAVSAGRPALALALAAATASSPARPPAPQQHAFTTPPSPSHTSRYAAALSSPSTTPPQAPAAPVSAPVSAPVPASAFAPAPAPAPAPSQSAPPTAGPAPAVASSSLRYRPLPPVPSAPAPPVDQASSLFSAPAPSLLPPGLAGGAPASGEPALRRRSQTPDSDAPSSGSGRGRAREPKEYHRFSVADFIAPLATLPSDPDDPPSPRSVRSEPAGPRTESRPRRSALRTATGRHSVDAVRAAGPLSASHARKRLRFLQQEGSVAEEPAALPGGEEPPRPVAPDERRLIVERLLRGSVLTKFAFTTGRRVARWVQLDNGPPRRLRWGDAASRRLTSSANVDDIVGLTHGPFASRAFERREAGRDADWLCFSLHFANRTVDLCAPTEAVLFAWYIGLQTLVGHHTAPAFPIYPPPLLRQRIEQMKAAQRRDGGSRGGSPVPPPAARTRSRSASPARHYADSPGAERPSSWGVPPIVSSVRRSSLL